MLPQQFVHTSIMAFLNSASYYTWLSVSLTEV